MTAPLLNWRGAVSVGEKRQDKEMRRAAVITILTAALFGGALAHAHAGFELRTEIGGEATVASVPGTTTPTSTPRPSASTTAPAETPAEAPAPLPPPVDTPAPEVERGTVPAAPELAPTTTTTTESAP